MKNNNNIDDEGGKEENLLFVDISEIQEHLDNVERLDREAENKKRKRDARDAELERKAQSDNSVFKPSIIIQFLDKNLNSKREAEKKKKRELNQKKRKLNIINDASSRVKDKQKLKELDKRLFMPLYSLFENEKELKELRKKMYDSEDDLEQKELFSQIIKVSIRVDKTRSAIKKILPLMKWNKSRDAKKQLRMVLDTLLSNAARQSAYENLLSLYHKDSKWFKMSEVEYGEMIHWCIKGITKTTVSEKRDAIIRKERRREAREKVERRRATKRKKKVELLRQFRVMSYSWFSKN